MPIRWTTPYLGVQHATVDGRQATVTDYGTFATATVFPRVGAPKFFNGPDYQFDTAALARAWVEDRFVTRRQETADGRQ